MLIHLSQTELSRNISLYIIIMYNKTVLINGISLFEETNFFFYF